MPGRGPAPLWGAAFDDAALAASGRRARTVWAAESAAKRDRLLELPPAPDRLAALDDEETRQLLTPEHRAEVLDSIARVTDANRIAAAERLERLRPWTLGLGVPLAAGLPFAVAIGASGWGFLDLMAAAGAALWPPTLPVLAVVLSVGAVGLCAWLVEVATSPNRLLAIIVGAFASGAAAVASASALPVYRAHPAARLADGSSIGGAVVWVDRLWPRQPDRLHVLRGNGRLCRSVVLTLSGGQPVRYLQGE